MNSVSILVPSIKVSWIHRNKRFFGQICFVLIRNDCSSLPSCNIKTSIRFYVLCEVQCQDSSSPNVDEEEADHDEQRSPSPQIHNHNESNTYGSDNFEENDDSES